MGFLQDIAASIGGDDLKRLSAGEANFDDPDSNDQQNVQELIKNIDPRKLQQILAQAAEKTNPQEYSDHITPGVGGTNPLGSLNTGALGSIAAAFVNQLKNIGSSSGVATRQSARIADN